jgi:hypothetical protein
MQQLMDLEMQGMGLGVQQRGQDIGALQNQLGLMLGARGQDLSARGQDIGAMLQQGQQALGARGQDIGAMGQGLSGMLGLNEQGLGQYQSLLDNLTNLGGRQRSIQDARLGAQYDELMRQYGLSRDAVFAPLGQLTSQVGSQTRTSGGGK